MHADATGGVRKQKENKKKELQNNLLGQVRNVRKIDPVDRQFAFFKFLSWPKKRSTGPKPQRQDLKCE
jgi:hypothetical protein